jgi:hypothetical protein
LRNRVVTVFKITHFSFGGTAAIVTNVALVIGLSAAGAAKSAIISSLMIVAVADNLTDSLSIHIYQESKRLERKEALRVTVANFVTRLAVSLIFVLFVLLLPIDVATLVSLLWGVLLLVVISYVIARDRHVSAISEILKHITAALVVVLSSQAVGAWIPHLLAG